MEPLSFESLSHELSRMQVQLLQRLKAPVMVSKEAIQLIRASASAIEPVTKKKSLITLFLRSCASIFKHVPPSMALPALEALDIAHSVAKSYVMNSFGDVNESASVLRSIIDLEKCEHELNRDYISAKATSQSTTHYSELLRPAYQTAMDRWHQDHRGAYTVTVISLIYATSLIFARGYNFPCANTDMIGLLPVKNKIDMEAKLQRCRGARELLIHLRDKKFNSIDAAMSLNTLAEVGFYDEEVCNKSLDVLHASQTLVSSSQLCEVIYSLGVLQHRHIHLRSLSDRMDASKCSANGVLRHIQGLAMLQHPPSSPRSLLDGVFLHAFRSQPGRHQHSRHAAPNTQSGSEQQDGGSYKLSPLWYVNVAHALACLNIKHHKFMLMTARQTRSNVGWLSTKERCKLLYGIGGVPVEDVPNELRGSWTSKVVPTLNKTFDKLKEIEPEEGMQVMRALRYCGVVNHPRIPVVEKIMENENPAEVIIKTWSSLSKERILDLTERVDPHQLGDSPSSTVASITHAVACACRSAGVNEEYRLGPLCNALNIHGTNMETNELIVTIKALHQIGLSGQPKNTLYNLLECLQDRQDELNETQLKQYQVLIESLRSSEHGK
ncbi:unnamed protein product [Phytomonas sp. EM1]|nr:unnamed protein product [Phytomonas sp. EM1]|eukprot:CCW63302.1 unnamed protein product [Phytomonas sp. isolate EM1]